MIFYFLNTHNIKYHDFYLDSSLLKLKVESKYKQIIRSCSKADMHNCPQNLASAAGFIKLVQKMFR